MESRELAYDKHALLTVKDWDIFQAVIRRYSKLLNRTLVEVEIEVGRKP